MINTHPHQIKESTFVFDTLPAPSSALYALAIDLVDACNLACTTCPRGLRRMKNNLRQMDFGLFDKITDKAARIGFKRIYLYNWTEPFLCLDLPRFTKKVKEKGLECQLSSNLSFRNIPHLIPALENCDTLIVSVSGFTQPIYRINHRGGNIELVKRQLDRIAVARARGEIATEVVIRYFNFPHSSGEWPDFEQFANERNFRILLWKGGGDPENKSPNLQKFWDYIIDGAPMNKPKKLEEPAQKAKICYTAIAPSNLDYKGDMYLCCMAPNCERTYIGNFLRDDFDRLMYRRVNHFLCKNCASMKPVDMPDHYAGWMLTGMLKEYGIPEKYIDNIAAEQKIIRQLAGREVYFWGHGSMLRRKWHEYASCKPRCILTDMEKYPESVNGVPVQRAEETLDDSRPLPIVIFAGEAAAGIIREKIARNFPGHTEVYACCAS